MYGNKPMKLLLIEDDAAECIKFKDCANSRTDIIFVGMTGSSEEGFKLVQALVPEGVILDLELHKGKGDGLQFLSDLRNANLRLRPLIVVTTNSPSGIVYKHVHKYGADLVYYKGQADYNPSMVINTLVALRESLYTVQRSGLPRDIQTIESPEERRIRILDRISTELDLIGIGARYKGRDYLKEAIFLLINKDKNSSESIIDRVAEQNKITYGNVLRVMQTAINKAWKISNIDDLEKYYTARVDVNTGVPTPIDFIHYYADKIRKIM